MAAAAASVTTGTTGTPDVELTCESSDDPAPEPRRGAGHVDEPGSDEAAVSDSATPEGQTQRDQAPRHRDLHRLVVDAEHNVAEPLLNGASDLDILLVQQRRDVLAVPARAVMRTLMPSMPEARKARRHLRPWCRGRRCGPGGTSASPDSLAPQVRSTRLAMTPLSSPDSAMRARRSGIMPWSNISAIS